jgi:hypothetical protein
MGDLSVLRDAGIPVDDYSDEEKAALEGLTDEETQALADIRRKLNASGGDDDELARRGDTGTIVW